MLLVSYVITTIDILSLITLFRFHKVHVNIIKLVGNPGLVVSYYVLIKFKVEEQYTGKKSMIGWLQAGLLNIGFMIR